MLSRCVLVTARPTVTRSPVLRLSHKLIDTSPAKCFSRKSGPPPSRFSSPTFHPPVFSGSHLHLNICPPLRLRRHRAAEMGSINCKEYVTTSGARANQSENGTTGSGSYHSTCEGTMNNEYTEPVVLCHQTEMREHDMKRFDFDENTKVLLVKQNGQLRAIGNKCPHYGAPLSTGALGDGRVRCPWHGACFNIETGDVEDFPGLDSLPCYKVDINQDGQVTVRAKRQDVANSKRIKDMVRRDRNDCRTFVVIGGGPAAAVCVETLRQEGFTGRIVMLCREKHLPYDRVKLSKATDIPIEQLQLRSMDFYNEYDIEAMLGVAATKVDVAKKTVQCSDGMLIKYDKMFIATGSSAHRPPIKGADLRNVVTVREYSDAALINQLIKPNTNLVCLGASFIGAESAQNWAKKVKSVTLVGRMEYPLSSSFGDLIGARVMRMFQENGVNMMMNNSIVEILGDADGKVAEVVLKDGSKLPCDVLIMGTGSRFNTDFLIGSGLPINANGSIDTDMYLQTYVPDVYAGGDIANAPVFVNANRPTTIGHYQLAQYHGRIAAINMVGRAQQELRAVPFFFTMLFGKGFRYSGYGPYSDIVIDGTLEELKFIAYFIDEQDKVVAVASCGRDPIVAQFAELQYQGKVLRRPDVENVADSTAWTKWLKEPAKCS